MKATTLIVLGGLLFAGTSLAAEPQQAPTTASGMKVGINPATGKLRPLNAAESAKLDAMEAARQKSATARAKANAKGKPLAKGERLTKEGLVTFTAANGMTIVQLDDSYMVDVQATIGADGKVVVTHDGQPVQGAVEAANE
ncbi:MAG TPA: hypothetical protein VN205_10780 [Thermomonas sp.]|nr:hypothetical protein [Thermomonas sp.]